ncbi:restriction endonuclease subunit S [Rhizobium laguerreae]|uniref:restriction endonuclease subunit S n=1 Tax=Rhizobium laguerreae TaxID=1076926 RepID=UPI001C90CD93|nr:restriction endonuclease subunit S [Rhizobium laguerreae]MBY3186673.1 restriction endonuclease subunit S [Rhizobium laguerreae]
MTIIARLGDLVEFYAGFGFPNQYQGSVEGEIPFAKVSDISRALEDGGNAIYRAANYVSGEVAHKLRAKPFPTGTIVFAKIGEAIRKNRRALTTREMLFDNNVMGVRPMNGKIDIDYLFRYLDTVDFYKLANTTAVPSLRKSVLGELQIPLPPLDEQRRIAAILDKANQLRQKRRQAIALLDSLTQSIFLEMFGDPVSNPKGWPEIKLADCCASNDDIKCGPFGTQLYQTDFRTSGVPLWGIKQVNKAFRLPTREFVSKAKAKDLEIYDLLPGDLVMTRKGTVGNSAIYPANFSPGIMHSDLLRVRLDPSAAAPGFMNAQLRYSGSIAHQLSLISGGAVMAGINVGKLKKITVLLPALADQRKFESVLGRWQTAWNNYEMNLSQQDLLFSSLQYRAFSGQL